MDCQKGEVLPPELPGHTLPHVARDNGIVQAFDPMEWSRMMHKLGVIESMTTIHQTDLGAIHSQMAAIEQALKCQTRGALLQESQGPTVKQATKDNSIVEKAEPAEWSRVSHKFDALESLAVSHQKHLDVIHSQVAAVEQRLKDSAKLTVHEPVTTEQNDVLMRRVMSMHEQLLQGIQKIESRCHPPTQNFLQPKIPHRSVPLRI